MPPSSTLIAMHNGEEMEAGSTHSRHAPVTLQMDENTRKRIGQVSVDRRRSSINSNARKQTGRAAVFEAASKFIDGPIEGEEGEEEGEERLKNSVDQDDDLLDILNKLNSSSRSFSNNKKRTPGGGRRARELDTSVRSRGRSPHAMRDRKQGIYTMASPRPEKKRSGSTGPLTRKESPSKAERAKVRAKSSDELPVASPLASPVKKRSNSVGALKKTVEKHRPGELPEQPSSPVKKRSSSLGPLKKEVVKHKPKNPPPPVNPRKKIVKKRASSVGPLSRTPSGASSTVNSAQSEPPKTPEKKKRASSVGPLGKSPRRERKPSMKREASTKTAQKAESSEETRDAKEGGLNAFLGKLGTSIRKRTGGSIASEPAGATSTRRSRRNSLGRLHASQRRTRNQSANLDDALVAEASQPEAPTPQRAKSYDDKDFTDFIDSENDSKRGERTRRGSKKKSSKNSDSTRSTRSTLPLDDDSSAAGGKEARKSRRGGMPRRSNSALPRISSPKPSENSEKKEDARSSRMNQLKRNQSMQPRMAMAEESAPQRAASLMLHRTETRRGGKSNSLADLVQYSEDEIHSTSYFASNHVLVNRERMKRGLRPLTRNIAMDEQARENAQRMADSKGKAPLKVTYVGNVLRGESIRAVHRVCMANKQGRERSNLLNPYFQEFGVGTAKGEDGMLYVCQLFSERLELTCLDTEQI